MDLRGRVAVVTGASGGIGSSTVRAFALRGLHLALAAPSSEMHLLDELAAEATRRGVRAIVVPTDVSNRADVDRLIGDTLNAFGTISVLANIAGIGSSPALCDDTDDDLERVIDVNLLGCARTMHAVLPVMKAQRSGAIVNVGSVAGEAGVMGIYSASKFGLRGLSDSVRREVRSHNISVTLIEPGFVRTPLNPEMDRLPSPDLVARAIVRAIERPRRRVIVPLYYSIPVFIANAFPGLIDLVFGNA
ncbi:MAG: SDR family NAD(P)-dependent oxidoreductase, partial [Candidatus Eremiobacteraeota bacterium]|nr:SDR family NAD(P)-dependent oxidoreductase [Candidatus Eremiobacteraeota bacterium]